MRDVHGERITARAMILYLLEHFDDDAELLIMLGSGDGAPAALMSWDESGPGTEALNVPVFTRMPDFYDRPDAPTVVSMVPIAKVSGPAASATMADVAERPYAGPGREWWPGSVRDMAEPLETFSRSELVEIVRKLKERAADPGPGDDTGAMYRRRIMIEKYLSNVADSQPWDEIPG